MTARAAITLLLAALAVAAQTAKGPPVTVLLQFEGEPSHASVSEMKREVSAIMGVAGFSLDYRLRSELGTDDTPPNLVLVRFRGKCSFDKLPPLIDERGPFAITHVTDGAILPFSEVACDKVTRSIRTSMNGSDLERGERLLGRALGRVVAHELYHIFSRSKEHGSKGVARTALKGSQLIADELGFDPAAIERLHSLH